MNLFKYLIIYIMKNDLKQFPLIERIIAVGVHNEEINSFFTQKRDLKQYINISDLPNDLNIKILEEYKANDLIETNNDNYTENISMVIINL